MRNLKKILALVLALVMTMSVMTVASAEFKDADKVNAKFATAVEVLNGLGVFKGYEDGTFNPTGAITRAEVAAIIYRIDTGDVTDKQVKIYSDYNKFDDVKSTEWYAGYVNYCANALYIRGYDENTFGPNDKVTGYQALAMILRVVGYDKNGEFSGSAWQIETAKYAQKLGITKNVDVNTLGAPATRELVAELLFRTITEVSDVNYTLLLGYTALDEYIGEYRFGLETAAGTDNWGRPYTGWTSFGKLIVKHEATPLYATTTPITHCDVTTLTNLKGAINVWENGVLHLNGEFINPLDTRTKIGEQGTVVEFYADRIVMVDTYLAVVTETIPQLADKAGHVYQAAANVFDIYGLEGENGVVAGNVYATGDYMLVRYNEQLKYVEPYAAPATVNGKQTHIWWNAEKHTIDGETYLDNVNYVLDAAKYDKDTAYTWFFDTNNNVIGSEEIIIPEADKVYAVVLGAQWINVQGDDGYAIAKLFYLNGDVTTEKIASVNDNEMKYTSTKGGDFTKGEVHTTYQYNENTEAHLYLVEEGKNGLELTEVKTELPTATLKDGKSKLYTDVYADNNTVFFYYNEKTDSVDVYVGYDNLPFNSTGITVDVIENKVTEFAQFVYIPSYTKDTTPTTPTEEKWTETLVYITGDAMNYKLKDRFALLGVVDGEGKTDALYFAMGNEAETEAILNNVVKFGQDTLVKVKVSSKTGLADAKTITPVKLGNDACADLKVTIKFVEAGEYKFINTGVLKIGDLAINVNHNTTIINDGEKGVAINDLAYLVGANLYIVYGEDEIADYIFVTVTARDDGKGETLAEAMVMALSEVDFEDVSATYEVAADTTVALVAEAVEAASTIDFITALTGETVTVVAKEVETEATDVRVFEVTITTGDATNTVTIALKIKAPAKE